MLVNLFEDASLPEIVSTEEITDCDDTNVEGPALVSWVELPSFYDLDVIQANKKGKGGIVPKKPIAETPERAHDVVTPKPDLHEPRGVKRLREDTNTLQLPSFPNSGGVPGFSTRSPNSEEPIPVETPVSEALAYDEHSTQENHDGLTQEIHQKAIEFEAEAKQSVIVRVYTPDSHSPAFVKMSPHDTVGSLTVAEHKLDTTGMPLTSIRIDSNLGLPIPSSQTPTSMQALFVTDIGKKRTQQCPCRSSSNEKPSIQYPTSRLSVLYQQGTWVADDEISFYFGLMEQEGLGNMLPPIVFHHAKPSDFELQSVTDLFRTLPFDHEKKFFSAWLLHNHWVPIVLLPCDDGYEIHSPTEGYDIIQQAIENQDITVKISLRKVVIPNFFPADCGFQALGCILGLLGTPKCIGSADGQLPPNPHSTWFSQHTAEGWRVLFEHHLLHTGIGASILSREVNIGGVGKDELCSQLSHLLHEHGVPSDQLESRTNMTIEKLGRTSLTKAFRASRPWAEIKGLANNAVPKVQLVMPSELQSVVAARLQDPTPFGDKRQKKQKNGKGPKQPIRLLASDLEITQGLFKQGDNVPLSQISHDAIGPDAQGVVLMNACDAYSYLKLTAPISKAGLAILILEHQDPALHGVGELLRFPARCIPTGEPIILTVKLVQVGSITVSRHCPDQQLSVDEVPTSVVRAIVFRDECDISWSQFLEHPVRHIVAQNQTLQDSGDQQDHEGHLILDVWDRQTLTKKFGKVNGADAEIFIVCIRVAVEDPRAILQTSGKFGTYYEPRSSDGRNPSEHYHVVWLNKVSKSDAVTAQQVAAIWTSVVRHGDRFGLRTTCDLASRLHEHHKPNSPFLSGQVVKKFLVGPFPFGATRIGILKI